MTPKIILQNGMKISGAFKYLFQYRAMLAKSISTYNVNYLSMSAAEASAAIASLKLLVGVKSPKPIVVRVIMEK